MKHVIILGAGKIGRAIAHLLAHSGVYKVKLCDANECVLQVADSLPNTSSSVIDVRDARALINALKGNDAVVCALAFSFSGIVAKAALEAGVSYFDLTEDIFSTDQVAVVAAKAKDGQVFMPQCGLAPGFTAIVAHSLSQEFEKIDSVQVRVGALPKYPTNALKYNLTWSTDGLINEYCNTCQAISEGELIEIPALSELDTFSVDGVRYEAFHTSGGLGTLCKTLEGKARIVNYKTVRYPGHRDLIRFLLDELNLRGQRAELKRILERAIPITQQDVVLIFCTVSGWIDGQYTQRTDVRKIYHAYLDGVHWSAIQITTAASICAVVDMTLAKAESTKGFVRQESIELEEFLENQFGRHYAHSDESAGRAELVHSVETQTI